MWALIVLIFENLKLLQQVQGFMVTSKAANHTYSSNLSQAPVKSNIADYAIGGSYFYSFSTHALRYSD